MKYNIDNDINLMANISTSIEVIASIFTQALTVFESQSFQMLDLENVCPDHRVEHS